MVDINAENTSCLHLVAASGDRAREDCLAQALPGDAIVFLDAGVLHLLTLDVAKRGPTGPAFLFAAADLDAHGLLGTARSAGVAILDDADICGLLAEHAHCLTWT